MNTLASSVQCRVIRPQLLSIIRTKNTSHPWLHNNHSVECVRLASTETKTGFLSKLKNIFNRSPDERGPMSPWIRSIVDLTPRGVQPPIREPNMPEKRDRKDDKKEQKEKKPVIIKTDTKADSKDGEQVYKYQWGVRVPDKNPEPRDDEKSPNYVVTQKWGVNMPGYKEPEDSNVQNTMKVVSVEPTAENPVATVVEKAQTVSIAQSSENEIEKLPLGVSAIDVSGSLPLVLPKNEDETMSQNPKSTVPPTAILDSDSYGNVDDDYNIPKEVSQDGEISAWQDVVNRSKLHAEDLARRIAVAAQLHTDPIDSIFIRPEPPESRIDVHIVRSNGKIGNSEQNVTKVLDLGPNVGGLNFTETKKLHTGGIQSFGYRRLASSCHTLVRTESFSTTSQRRKDFDTFPPDSERSAKTETDEETGIQASPGSDEVPKAEQDLGNVLQELSQREMEVFLSYKQQSSEENGTFATLPTTVEITTFPPESLKHTLVSVHQDGDESLNSTVNEELTELEKTILKLNEMDDKDEVKDIKDKKGIKDGDYVRLPGDPYPYNREHYEKWRLPHGKCPIVNDDVPKVKPAEKNDSPRSPET